MSLNSNESESKDAASWVRLRSVEAADLPLLFEFQSDPDSNKMAFTRPRRRQEFDEHWNHILTDPSVTAKAILAHDQLAGCISCFSCDDMNFVGYWMGKNFWGKGIATAALKLLLAGVKIRPLCARVAIENAASIRVLQKCGFVIVRHEWSPASERNLECEEAVLELN